MASYIRRRFQGEVRGIEDRLSIAGRSESLITYQQRLEKLHKTVQVHASCVGESYEPEMFPRIQRLIRQVACGAIVAIGNGVDKNGNPLAERCFYCNDVVECECCSHMHANAWINHRFRHPKPGVKEYLIHLIFTHEPPKSQHDEIDYANKTHLDQRKLAKKIRNHRNSKNRKIAARWNILDYAIGLHLKQTKGSRFMSPHLHGVLRLGETADADEIIEKLAVKWKDLAFMRGIEARTEVAVDGTRLITPTRIECALLDGTLSTRDVKNIAAYAKRRSDFDDTPEISAYRRFLLQHAGISQTICASNPDEGRLPAMHHHFRADVLNKDRIHVFTPGAPCSEVGPGIPAEQYSDMLNETRNSSEFFVLAALHPDVAEGFRRAKANKNSETRSVRSTKKYLPPMPPPLPVRHAETEGRPQSVRQTERKLKEYKPSDRFRKGAKTSPEYRKKWSGRAANTAETLIDPDCSTLDKFNALIDYLTQLADAKRVSSEYNKGVLEQQYLQALADALKTVGHPSPKLSATSLFTVVKMLHFGWHPEGRRLTPLAELIESEITYEHIVGLGKQLTQSDDAEVRQKAAKIARSLLS